MNTFFHRIMMSALLFSTVTMPEPLSTDNVSYSQQDPDDEEEARKKLSAVSSGLNSGDIAILGGLVVTAGVVAGGVIKGVRKLYTMVAGKKNDGTSSLQKDTTSPQETGGGNTAESSTANINSQDGHPSSGVNGLEAANDSSSSGSSKGTGDGSNGTNNDNNGNNSSSSATSKSGSNVTGGSNTAEGLTVNIDDQDGHLSFGAGGAGGDGSDLSGSSNHTVGNGNGVLGVAHNNFDPKKPGEVGFSVDVHSPGRVDTFTNGRGSAQTVFEGGDDQNVQRVEVDVVEQTQENGFSNVAQEFEQNFNGVGGRTPFVYEEWSNKVVSERFLPVFFLQDTRSDQSAQTTTTTTTTTTSTSTSDAVRASDLVRDLGGDSLSNRSFVINTPDGTQCTISTSPITSSINNPNNNNGVDSSVKQNTGETTTTTSTCLTSVFNVSAPVLTASYSAPTTTTTTTTTCTSPVMASSMSLTIDDSGGMQTNRSERMTVSKNDNGSFNSKLIVKNGGVLLMERLKSINQRIVRSKDLEKLKKELQGALNSAVDENTIHYVNLETGIDALGLAAYSQYDDVFNQVLNATTWSQQSLERAIGRLLLSNVQSKKHRIQLIIDKLCLSNTSYRRQKDCYYILMVCTAEELMAVIRKWSQDDIQHACQLLNSRNYKTIAELQALKDIVSANVKVFGFSELLKKLSASARGQGQLVQTASIGNGSVFNNDSLIDLRTIENDGPLVSLTASPLPLSLQNSQLPSVPQNNVRASHIKVPLVASALIFNNVKQSIQDDFVVPKDTFNKALLNMELGESEEINNLVKERMICVDNNQGTNNETISIIITDDDEIKNNEFVIRFFQHVKKLLPQDHPELPHIDTEFDTEERQEGSVSSGLFLHVVKKLSKAGVVFTEEEHAIIEQVKQASYAFIPLEQLEELKTNNSELFELIAAEIETPLNSFSKPFLVRFFEQLLKKDGITKEEKNELQTKIAEKDGNYLNKEELQHYKIKDKNLYDLIEQQRSKTLQDQKSQKKEGNSSLQCHQYTSTSIQIPQDVWRGFYEEDIINIDKQIKDFYHNTYIQSQANDSASDCYTIRFDGGSFPTLEELVNSHNFLDVLKNIHIIISSTTSQEHSGADIVASPYLLDIKKLIAHIEKTYPSSSSSRSMVFRGSKEGGTMDVSRNHSTDGSDYPELPCSSEASDASEASDVLSDYPELPSASNDLDDLDDIMINDNTGNDSQELSLSRLNFRLTVSPAIVNTILLNLNDDEKKILRKILLPYNRGRKNRKDDVVIECNSDVYSVLKDIDGGYKNHQKYRRLYRKVLSLLVQHNSSQAIMTSPSDRQKKLVSSHKVHDNELINFLMLHSNDVIQQAVSKFLGKNFDKSVQDAIFAFLSWVSDLVEESNADNGEVVFKKDAINNPLLKNILNNNNNDHQLVLQKIAFLISLLPVSAPSIQTPGVPQRSFHEESYPALSPQTKGLTLIDLTKMKNSVWLNSLLSQFKCSELKLNNSKPSSVSSKVPSEGETVTLVVPQGTFEKVLSNINDDSRQQVDELIRSYTIIVQTCPENKDQETICINKINEDLVVDDILYYIQQCLPESHEALSTIRTLRGTDVLEDSINTKVVLLAGYNLLKTKAITSEQNDRLKNFVKQKLNNPHIYYLTQEQLGEFQRENKELYELIEQEYAKIEQQRVARKPVNDTLPNDNNDDMGKRDDDDVFKPRQYAITSIQIPQDVWSEFYRDTSFDHSIRKFYQDTYIGLQEDSASDCYTIKFDSKSFLTLKELVNQHSFLQVLQKIKTIILNKLTINNNTIYSNCVNDIDTLMNYIEQHHQHTVPTSGTVLNDLMAFKDGSVIFKQQMSEYPELPDESCNHLSSSSSGSSSGKADVKPIDTQTQQVITVITDDSLNRYTVLQSSQLPSEITSDSDSVNIELLRSVLHKAKNQCSQDQNQEKQALVGKLSALQSHCDTNNQQSSVDWKTLQEKYGFNEKLKQLYNTTVQEQRRNKENDSYVESSSKDGEYTINRSDIGMLTVVCNNLNKNLNTTVVINEQSKTLNTKKEINKLLDLLLDADGKIKEALKQHIKTMTFDKTANELTITSTVNLINIDLSSIILTKQLSVQSQVLLKGLSKTFSAADLR